MKLKRLFLSAALFLGALAILDMGDALRHDVEAQPELHEPNSSIAPYAEAVALVENDTTLISPPCRAMYVSTVGDVVVDMQRTGTSITFTAVPAGVTLPIRFKRFKVASTATGVCLY
jgi:hypothetical protein